MTARGKDSTSHKQATSFSKNETLREQVDGSSAPSA